MPTISQGKDLYAHTKSWPCIVLYPVHVRRNFVIRRYASSTIFVFIVYGQPWPSWPLSGFSCWSTAVVSPCLPLPVITHRTGRGDEDKHSFFEWDSKVMVCLERKKITEHWAKCHFKELSSFPHRANFMTKYLTVLTLCNMSGLYLNSKYVTNNNQGLFEH